jgi:Regulator of chromosome condensation (RCC1) repeat
MATTTVGKLRFNPRDTWVSLTAYSADDIVIYKNQFYMARAAVTSATTPDLDPTNWTLYGGGTYHAGEYAAGTTYAVGDMVTYTRVLTYNSHHNYAETDTYICIQAGTGQTPSTATAYWTKISTGAYRDKWAFLSGINEGYVAGQKSAWDTWAQTSSYVGPGDSFGEFKTPGSHLVSNGAVQYVTRRYGLVHMGANPNTDGFPGVGLTGDTNYQMAEAGFTHLSWFDGTLPTSPTNQAPRILQVEGDMYANTMVLFDNGEIHRAGYNAQGQNGIGSTTNWNFFVQCGYGNINRTGSTTVLRSKKAIRIAMSSDGTTRTASCYALIRNSDDTRELYAWGYNGYGQLGQGNTSDLSVPTLVSFDQTTNGKIVEIWATGGNYAQMFFLTAQGKMYAMGYNGNSNLGVGDATNRSSPTLVKAWGATSTTFVKKFNTGGGCNSGSTASYLVVRGDNTLWTWGYNGQGQLAHGHTYNCGIPTQVYTAGYTGVTVATTTATGPGTPSGSAITDCWNAWMCGGNYGYMYVLRGSSAASNTAYSCGRNGNYQLSYAANTTTDVNLLTAVQYRSGTAMTNVEQIAANTGSGAGGNAAFKRRTDNDWYFVGYTPSGGAWSTGYTETHNENVLADPDGITSNFRLKNNLLYSRIMSNANKTYWKYYPMGHDGFRMGMYVDLMSGKVYVTSTDNTGVLSNTTYNSAGSPGTRIMTKLKGI